MRLKRRLRIGLVNGKTWGRNHQTWGETTNHWGETTRHWGRNNQILGAKQPGPLGAKMQWGETTRYQSD